MIYDERLFWAQYLKWNRSRTTGLTREDLKAEVSSTDTAQFTLEEVNLNVDELATVKRKETLRKATLKNALRNI